MHTLIFFFLVSINQISIQMKKSDLYYLYTYLYGSGVIKYALTNNLYLHNHKLTGANNLVTTVVKRPLNYSNGLHIKYKRHNSEILNIKA